MASRTTAAIPITPITTPAAAAAAAAAPTLVLLPTAIAMVVGMLTMGGRRCARLAVVVAVPLQHRPASDPRAIASVAWLMGQRQQDRPW